MYCHWSLGVQSVKGFSERLGNASKGSTNCSRNTVVWYGDLLTKNVERTELKELVSSSLVLESGCVHCTQFTFQIVTWLILPVVICLSQRLSHACLSISTCTVKLRMAH